ncbi:ankyrin repeat domain-containing protein [Halovulum sp. GXIMD14794]
MGFEKKTFVAAFLCAASATAEPIHLAAKQGDVEALSRLLAEGTPVDQPSTEGTSSPGVSALYVAVKWGKLEAVELLLESGANPNAVANAEQVSETPLMAAAKTGRGEIIATLLGAGADPNLTTEAGTALHFATMLKRQAVVDQLMAAGALDRIAQPSIESRLAEANIERGGELRRRCQYCHGDIADRDLEASENPKLWDIVGKPKASQPGVKYTDALAELGGTWSYDELNSFLANPGAFVPGTTMWGVGIPLEQDRIDLIAYMRTLSDDPAPLP